MCAEILEQKKLTVYGSQDNHTVNIYTGALNEEEVAYSLRDFMRKFNKLYPKESSLHYINVIRGFKTRNLTGITYIWIESSIAYNLIRGKKDDGSDNTEIKGEYKIDFNTPCDWADLCDEEEEEEVIELPDVLHLSLFYKRGRDFAEVQNQDKIRIYPKNPVIDLTMNRSIVSDKNFVKDSRNQSHILKSTVPSGLFTKLRPDDIRKIVRDKFNPFVMDKDPVNFGSGEHRVRASYPMVFLSNEKEKGEIKLCVYVIFGESQIDGMVADTMCKQLYFPEHRSSPKGDERLLFNFLSISSPITPENFVAKDKMIKNKSGPRDFKSDRRSPSVKSSPNTGRSSSLKQSRGSPANAFELLNEC